MNDTIIPTQPGVLRPFKFLDCSKVKDFILVLLNQEWLSPVTPPTSSYFKHFEFLWNKASFKASVDGGTNVLHEINKNCNFKFIPDLISGDFDSIQSNLLQFYESHGSEVVPTPDQNHTDFTKCLQLLAEKYKNNLITKEVDNVVVLLGHYNRFDQAMANICTLFKSRTLLPLFVHVNLLTLDTFLCLIPKGEAWIDVKIPLHYKTPDWCILLAIHKPAVVTTSGLKEDLVNEILRGPAFLPDHRCLDKTKTLKVNTDQPLVLILPLERIFLEQS